MPGIAAFAAYVPWRRLNRRSVVEANGWLNPALAGHSGGTRAMASWDEDSVTMAVEAARLALLEVNRSAIESVRFASTTAPFADRQNAGIVAAALGLPETIGAVDVGGSQRAATTALIHAFDAVAAGREGNVLLAASDRRRAQAASAQELLIGDAAAAFLVSSGEGVARLVTTGSITTDFVDHYREANRSYDYAWEERWVRDEGLRKIVPRAVKRTLEAAGIHPSTVDHFICPTTFTRADTEIAAKVGIDPSRLRDDLAQSLGNSGVAHPLVMLVDALESAKPGEIIAVASFGQGCDVLLFEVTAAIDAYRSARSVAEQLEQGKVETNYMRFLVFNDLIDWEKGKRAERDKQTALTTLYRRRDTVMALAGGECDQCGTRQFPKTRICVNPNCRALDSQQPVSFAEQKAKVISWSADNLVFTQDPPLHYGMIAFDQGGRFLVEFADFEPAEINTGAIVRMAFRVKDYDAARGFRRYFWKAVPERTSPGDS